MKGVRTKRVRKYVPVPHTSVLIRMGDQTIPAKMIEDRGYVGRDGRHMVCVSVDLGDDYVAEYELPIEQIEFEFPTNG